MVLTIVAPFYNEEAGARAFYEALVHVVDQLDAPVEMVFVDDGSRDRTLELLNAIADDDPRVSVLSLSRNFGHQAALTAGLDHANGDMILMMDSDLQHPPAVIPQMLDAYENGASMVYGVRRTARNLGFFKRLTANAYYRLLRRMSNIEVMQGAADFRLMSRDALLALRRMREYHRYLRGMVPWLGFPSAVIYYDQPDRFAGDPVYTWRKSLRLAKDGLFSFTTIPLDLIAGLGVMCTVLALAYLAYILVVWAQGRAVEGWTSVIAVVLVIGGIQLISIGTLAQYTGMIFEQVKDRPLYVLKQQRLPQRAQEDESPHAG